MGEHQVPEVLENPALFVTGGVPQLWIQLLGLMNQDDFLRFDYLVGRVHLCITPRQVEDKPAKMEEYQEKD